MSTEEQIRIFHGKEVNSKLLRFEHHAMHTIFEIQLIYEELDYAEKAAHAAFAELDRLEQELSRFLPNSEISRINKLNYLESLVVSPDTFYCLQECSRLYNLSKGTFDISAGPIIDLWKPQENKPTSNKYADPKVLKAALNLTGLSWLHLDPESFTVELFSSGIALDLGGYGKGYALKCMREVLEEWGIKQAILHSGFSTVLGYSEEKDHGWPVSFQIPDCPNTPQYSIRLGNQSISGSGIAKGTHIVDPRNGKPADKRLASWVIADRPDHADALSTAFLLMDEEYIRKLCNERDDLAAIIVEKKTLVTDSPIVKLFGKIAIF